MPFPVVDRKLMQALKPGDKVRVKVEQVHGTFTVTALELER
jgi:Cu/Ag efflux protein CusF